MFRRRPEPIAKVEWLIVGLGNPGPEYRGTRHNVGFEVIDILAERHRIKMDQAKHKARFGVGGIDGTGVALVKPLTYMNLSGQAVAPMAKQYGILPDHILVVTDDTDLPPGKIRLRATGAAGGHNGHKSLIASLGTVDYPRVKIGIGRVSKDSTVDHVLGKFTGDEREEMLRVLDRSADAVQRILLDGIERASGEFNGG